MLKRKSIVIRNWKLIHSDGSRYTKITGNFEKCQLLSDKHVGLLNTIITYLVLLGKRIFELNAIILYHLVLIQI